MPKWAWKLLGKEEGVVVLIVSFWHGVWLPRHDEIATGVPATAFSVARGPPAMLRELR